MEKISVSIRVRPLDKQEAAKGNPWKINNNAITLINTNSSTATPPVYVFDHVFGMDSTTLDIYKSTTRDIVASAVKGINGTVLAYGQTSSGKTFTMRGSQDEPGIIPRAIHDVFRNLEEAVNREFLLRMSYMEIYNEDINDLLAPEQTKLQVHENLERGIFVAGLREEIVTSPEQVLQMMEFGEAHRHVGETNMNVHSSRSHTIFRMVIESRDKSQDDSLGFSCDAVRVSVLNLVDLAGSERVAKTGAEGARLKEGTHINKSLMVLGTVINKLSEGVQSQGGHVPYRDSKLTRILQPALGGNARTAVICNITPAMVHVDESRGTLQFASRAICVTNCAQVNEILTDAALLKRQKKEIEELRCKLKASHSEHFEEEILSLRNTLLQSEYERERIAFELQEEKRAHAEREQKQAQKIENLSTLVLNSTVDDRDFEKRTKKNARRETWCPRVASENPLVELISKPLKEERCLSKNRDRIFSLPPPFDSLVEEDDFKDSNEVDESFFEQQNGNAKAVLPDVKARMHVADRKRKYSPRMPTLNEDDFQEQGNLSKRQEQDDSVQGKSMNTKTPTELVNICDDQQTGSTNETIQKLLLEKIQANEEITGCNNQFDSAMLELEKIKALNIELKASLAEAEESIKLQEKRLNDKSNILEATQAKLALVKKANEAMSEELIDCKASNTALESIINNLKTAQHELLEQLTDAHLQFEAEKAAWGEVQNKPISNMMTNTDDAGKLKLLEDKVIELHNELSAANLTAENELQERIKKCEEIAKLHEKITGLESMVDTLKENGLRRDFSLIQNDDIISKTQNHEDLKAKYHELQNFVGKITQEKDECLLLLESYKMKIGEYHKEVADAKSVAEQERNLRVSEIKDLEVQLNELGTMLLQERELRESDLNQIRDLQTKLCVLEDSMNRNAVEFSKEKCDLEKQNIKLLVSLDAVSAKREVYEGRWHEAMDELEEMHKELNHLKTSYNKFIEKRNCDGTESNAEMGQRHHQSMILEKNIAVRNIIEDSQNDSSHQNKKLTNIQQVLTSVSQKERQ